MLNRLIAALLVVTVSFAASSCTPVLKLVYGIKKPKKESDESVVKFVQRHHLDYDYLIRPTNDSAYRHVIAAISKGQLNGIMVYSSDGDLLINTNDSTCHLGVRSQLTAAIRSGSVPKEVSGSVNIRSLIQSETVCLNRTDQSPLFSHPLKRYILIFGVAKFIPLKPKLTDVDYVQELRDAGIRDSVTVVLLSTDKLDLQAPAR